MAQTQSTESNQAGAPKLAHPLFHVTLVEPEIPNNTGNIGRTCVALGCKLHLIHPLGFDTSEKACRRAGLDYWPRLDVEHHTNFAAYQSALLTPSPSSRQTSAAAITFSSAKKPRASAKSTSPSTPTTSSRCP